jgi:hypothetical protein
MATSAQITANQHNASLSTGPKTPEGKAAAARNATKHGLSGAFTVLPHEDQDEFDILLACLRDEFKPAGEHESFLVEQMAQSRWRLARAGRLETAMLDQMLKGYTPADDDQRIAANLLQSPHRTAEIAPVTKRTQDWPPATDHWPLRSAKRTQIRNQPHARRRPDPGGSPRPPAIECSFCETNPAMA